MAIEKETTEYFNETTNKGNIDSFFKQLSLSSNSTKKQEQLLEKLKNSSKLLEKYLEKSSECQEIFKYLDETAETFNELANSSIKLNVNETNADILFECIEKSILYYQSLNESDSKQNSNFLCTNIINKYSQLIKKCLQMKSNTKKTIQLQETCVKLLTLCVQQSVELAKRIALEYDYFNEYKNWLERYLLMKQTELRELSIRFLLSFLKHIKVVSNFPESVNNQSLNNDTENEKVKAISTGGDNREMLLLVKRIFLTTNNGADNSKINSKKANNNSSNNSSLIYCLFVHISTDSLNSIEFLLQELLFRFIQNESFNKSEKVRLFNEKTLANLIKLFEWKDPNDQNEQTLIVREIITEFLKILFCSTKHGISFYDRTLNIDQSAKNNNHLIFNVLINIPRPNLTIKNNQHELNKKTNKLIDDLLLKTLKICPDLIQRFLKVKNKQEQNNKESDEWFLRFCIQIFDQQLSCIKTMRKNFCSSTSFLRSLATTDINSLNLYSDTYKNLGDKTIENHQILSNFICDLIIHTSLPLCISFQKLLAQQSTATGQTSKFNKVLDLMISCLNCLKEWKDCLKEFQNDYAESEYDQLQQTEHHVKQRQIFENLNNLLANDSQIFFTKLDFELLTKYLPKFDTFLNLSSLIKPREENETDVIDNTSIIRSFEIFSLYFDIFMNIKNDDEKVMTNVNRDNTHQEIIGNFLNMLRIDSLESNLAKIIQKILMLDIKTPFDNEEADITLCLKYLKFLAKYLKLKQNEQYFENDSFDSISNANLIDLNIKLQAKNTNNYSIDYKNLNLYNMINIMFKFKNEYCFQLLIDGHLKVIDVYLNDNDDQHNLVDSYEKYLLNRQSNDTFKYDKSNMYLFLLLVKKHFDILDKSTVQIEMNVFKDFVYTCLFNLLSLKQRNLIIFQLNYYLNENNELKNSNQAVLFDQLLAFICLKTYAIFSQKFESLENATSYKSSIELIYNFLLDYLLSSGLIRHSWRNIDLNHQFDLLLKNNVLSENIKRQTNGEIEAEKKSNIFNNLRDDLMKCLDKVNNLEVVGSSIKEAIEVKCLAETYMMSFEEIVKLKTNVNHNAFITYLNLDLRVRHLFYLLNLVLKKNESRTDLVLILENLKNCLSKANEMEKLNKQINDKVSLNDRIDTKYIDSLFKFILNNPILIENVFINKKITKFLRDSLKILEANSNYFKYFQIYLDLFCNFLNEQENEKIETKDNLEFIAELCYSKNSYQKLIINFIEPECNDISEKKSKSIDDQVKVKFSFFVKILIKNQNYLFENDLHFFDELNSLEEKHVDSLKLFSRCLKILLVYLSKLDSEKLELEESQQEVLEKFLIKAHQYEPLIFKLIIQCIEKNKFKISKNLKKFASNNSHLSDILEKTLKDNVSDDKMQIDVNADSNDGVFILNDKEKLVKEYTFTLLDKDELLLRKLYKLDPKLDCLKFSLANMLETNKKESSNNADILNKQVKMYDFINLKLDFHLMSQSIHNYPIERKFDDVKGSKKIFTVNNVYDPIYLLPNFYNLLEYSNIVDLLQFIQNKCLSYLMASLSSECDYLRLLAYGCLYKLIAHLENSHIYCKNVILYLIELVRNSIDKENQRLPSVISAFLAEAIMVIIEPGTFLYKPIMSFLLLKPTLDLANVPEFYKLFNSSSLQYKIERKWILRILSYSCRTSLDYRLLEKRFVFRQVLSIYDSKMCDSELRVVILNLILKTCECKFALIDLIKRHYLLLWLTSVLESLTQLKLNQNEINFYLFLQQAKIFNKIWMNLGQGTSKNENELLDEESKPPITFLNQMYTLMRIFLSKLKSNHQKFVKEMSLESLADESTSTNKQSNLYKFSFSEQKLILDEFLNVKNGLMKSIKKYDFNLIQYENINVENMDTKIINYLNKQVEDCEEEKEYNIKFENILDAIDHLNETNFNKRKLDNSDFAENINDNQKKLKIC